MLRRRRDGPHGDGATPSSVRWLLLLLLWMAAGYGIAEAFPRWEDPGGWHETRGGAYDGWGSMPGWGQRPPPGDRWDPLLLPPPPTASSNLRPLAYQRPIDVMVDVTNKLAVDVLEDHVWSTGNFAFSPYGCASVLVVLWEGARGSTKAQIAGALRLSWDHDVTRVGLRDVHRHLRSYFTHEGYLSGMTLSKNGTVLRPSFNRILRFYGYDADFEMGPPSPTPTTTTTTTGTAPTDSGEVSSESTESAESGDNGSTSTSTEEESTSSESSPSSEKESSSESEYSESSTENEHSSTSKEESSTEKEYSSTNKGESSTEKESPSTEKESPSTEKESPSTEKESPSTESYSTECATTEQESSSTEKVSSSTNKEESSTEKEYSSTNKEESLTEKESSPTEKESSSTEKEHSSTEKVDSSTEKVDSFTEKVDSSTEKEYSPVTISPTAEKETEVSNEKPGTTDGYESEATTKEEGLVEKPAYTTTGPDSTPANKEEEGTTQSKPEETQTESEKSTETQKEAEYSTSPNTEASTQLSAESSPISGRSVTPSDTEQSSFAKMKVVETEIAEAMAKGDSKAVSAAMEKLVESAMDAEKKSGGAVVNATATGDEVVNESNVDKGSVVSATATGDEVVSKTKVDGKETEGVSATATGDEVVSKTKVDGKETEGVSATARGDEVVSKTKIGSKENEENSATSTWTEVIQDEKSDVVSATATGDEVAEASVYRRTSTTKDNGNSSEEDPSAKNTTSILSTRMMTLDEAEEKQTTSAASQSPPAASKATTKSAAKRARKAKGTAARRRTTAAAKAKGRSRRRRSVGFQEANGGPRNRLEGAGPMGGMVMGSRPPASGEGMPKLPFVTDDGRTVQTPVMIFVATHPYAFVKSLDAHALELPLDDERYRLLLLVPRGRYNLKQLSQALQSHPLGVICDQLLPTRVHAVVPPFAVHGFVSLSSSLRKLGIWDVFEPEHADLSVMSDDPDLFVRNVEQAVAVVIRDYVEIYDVQSRRAGGRTRSGNSGAVRVHATHPFLFFVVDAETRIALVAGKIGDPRSSRIH